MAGSIHRRIHHLNRCGELTVRIHLRAEREAHACFHLRDIRLGNSHQCLQFVYLRQHHNRLTAVQLAVLVVLRRDNARERRLHIRVRAHELIALFRLIERQLHLVVLLLRHRPCLNQALHTTHLGLKVGDGVCRGLVLLLIHTHQRVALAHFITYFHIDMLYFARQRGSYIHGLIALQVGGDGYLSLNLAGVQRG